MTDQTKIAPTDSSTTPKKRGPGRPKKSPSKTDEKFVGNVLNLASSIKATGAVTMSPDRAKTEPKVEVWMGTTDECPYWTVHAGGADFPRYNERVETDPETGHTRRERFRGKVMEMTRTDIEVVARAVGRKAVRKTGARSFILNLNSPRYRENGTDRPLGEYVYMQILSEGLPHDWRTMTPETMA